MSSKSYKYKIPTREGSSYEIDTFKQAIVHDAIMDGAQLDFEIFGGAGLIGTSFKKASLRDTDFSNAMMVKANLEGADLRFANLSGANLRDANFKDADIRYANLSRTDKRGCNLIGAKMKNTIIQFSLDEIVQARQYLKNLEMEAENEGRER